MEKQQCGEGRDRTSAERPHPLLARKSRWAGGRWGCQAALQVDLPPPGDTPEDAGMLPVRGVGGVLQGELLVVAASTRP